MFHMSNRAFSIVLVISLVVNVLVIGMITGALMHEYMEEKEHHSRKESEHDNTPLKMGLNLGEMLYHAPSERRRELLPVIYQQREKNKPYIRDMRYARQAVNQTLLANNFNDLLLEKRLQKLQEKTCTAREKIHESFVVLAKQLTDKERRYLVSSNKKRPPTHSQIRFSHRIEHISRSRHSDDDHDDHYDRERH